MKRQESLFSNTVILSVAAMLSKATVFFLMPFYTAYLTPADFGNADVLVGTALLLLPFVSLNMPEAIFRFFADNRCEKREFFSAGVLLMAIGAFAAFLIERFFHHSARPESFLFSVFAIIFFSLIFLGRFLFFAIISISQKESRVLFLG